MANDHIWESYGILPEKFSDCDAAMPHLIEAVKLLGPDIAPSVLREAVFQVVELPKRTEAFRQLGEWKP